MLELRTNCHLELYDVEYLLGFLMAHSEGVAVRFTGVGAVITSVTTNVNVSVSALVAVLPSTDQRRCAVAGNSETSITLTRCNVSVVHHRQGLILLATNVGVNKSGCFSNTAVVLENSNVAFQAPEGDVALFAGAPTINASFAQVSLVKGTLIVFSGFGCLLTIDSIQSTTLFRTQVLVSASSVVVQGIYGALLRLTSRISLHLTLNSLCPTGPTLPSLVMGTFPLPPLSSPQMFRTY